MQVERTSIPGVLAVSNAVHHDDRGYFLEWFRADAFELATGHAFTLRQANCSVSARGTLRGVHFADVPPGQAKFVTCVAGSVLDVAVDLRVGSPTFGRTLARDLSAGNRDALYLPEGIGHAFLALQDDASIVYLCSTPYAPEREHEVNPLDPELDIDWPERTEFLVSPKDAAAPGLAEAQASGLLPRWEACQAFVADLAAATPGAATASR